MKTTIINVSAKLPMNSFDKKNSVTYELDFLIAVYIQLVRNSQKFFNTLHITHLSEESA